MMTSPQDRRELLQNEEYLQRLHNMVLEQNRDFLCRNGTINPRHHYPFLRTNRILNREICAEIDHTVGPTAKANRFIDELQRNGGSKALVHFLESLRRDGTQIFVLKRLNETLANLRDNPPPIAPLENNSFIQPHHQQSREGEESSIESLGDISSSPLQEGPMADSTVHLLMPGEPGAPPLPSLETLAKCMPSEGQTSEAEKSYTPQSKLMRH